MRRGRRNGGEGVGGRISKFTCERIYLRMWRAISNDKNYHKLRRSPLLCSFLSFTLPVSVFLHLIPSSLFSFELSFLLFSPISLSILLSPPVFPSFTALSLLPSHMPEVRHRKRDIVRGKLRKSGKGQRREAVLWSTMAVQNVRTC